MMKPIGVTTDCVCDLPDEYLKLHDIDIVYFYITTATGRFRDGLEVTAGSILEYLENGGEKAETNAPAPHEYKEFFDKSLKKYDEIIHISISSGISDSKKNAVTALDFMGDDRSRIHVIDSEHLSTGMGLMVIKDVEMRDNNCTVEEIIDEMKNMKNRVSTSFITVSADYLYRNGRVKKSVRDITDIMQLHPVLYMKNGRMSLKGVRIGNFNKSVLRYVKSELKSQKKIDKRRIFITYAYCSVKMVAEIKAVVEEYCRFDEIIVTKASATIAGNCGPGTVGILFVYE